MACAKARRDNVEEKNARVAEDSLKYRSALQDKIDMGHKKHQKNRNEVLNKVVKSEERKMKYVKERNFVYEHVRKSLFRRRNKNSRKE